MGKACRNPIKGIFVRIINTLFVAIACYAHTAYSRGPAGIRIKLSLAVPHGLGYGWKVELRFFGRGGVESRDRLFFSSSISIPLSARGHIRFNQHHIIQQQSNNIPTHQLFDQSSQESKSPIWFHSQPPLLSPSSPLRL
jgi:hypothetical protein